MTRSNRTPTREPARLPCHRSGMTLMELVVALVILAITAAAGTSAFDTLIDHRKIVRDATVSTERAAALRGMIRGWLAAGNVQARQGGVPQLGRSASAAPASAASSGGMSNSAITAAQSAGDELTFITSAPNPTMQANVRIRLYVDVDANTPEKGLSIEFQRSTASPLERRMLDSTIDSLVVEYLDNRTNRWFGASQVATITPRAVRLTMLATDNKPIPRLLRVPIVLALGNTASLTGQGLAGLNGGGQ
jgi:prepilin-type N-terminal cleavage/methylation domain-containing protein